MKQVHIDAQKTVMKNEHVLELRDILSKKDNVHNVIICLRMFFDSKLKEVKDDFSLSVSVLVLKPNAESIDIATDSAFQQIQHGVPVQQLRSLLSTEITLADKSTIVNAIAQEIDDKIQKYYSDNA